MVEMSIRRLTVEDAPAWRVLRLEMLALEPQGFLADLDVARSRRADDWSRSIPSGSDAIFGLFARETLVGSCGFYVEKGAKLMHKGQMWGVYVRREFRGQGHAGALVQAVIEHARSHVEVLLTGASAAGAPVYERAGFVVYGTEPDAYRVDGMSLDNRLMALRFGE